MTSGFTQDTSYGGYQGNAIAGTSIPQVYDTELHQQSSVYLPGASQDVSKPRKILNQGKRDTVIRKGNGKTWEDPTLIDWDPSEYAINVKWLELKECQNGSVCLLVMFRMT